MQDYRDFSVGDKFEGLNDFVTSLHNTNKHYIPIVDAGIAVRNYGPFNEAMDQDLLIKINGEPFFG